MIALSIIAVVVCAALIALAMAWKPIGRTPQGERLERIKKSPHYRDGQFHNLHPMPMMTSGKSRWETMWEFLTADKPKELSPDKPVKAMKTNLSEIDPDTDQIVWFGHSSYLIITSGRRILVNPVLTSQYPVSLMMKPFKGSDIYEPEDLPAIDYLIITHDHYDHLDYGTVKAIRGKVGNVICPLGVGEHFEYWGYDPEKIIEMDWNEDVNLPYNIKVTCLPARHFSGRFIKQNPTLWASFMVEGTSTVYIGGDSGYDTHFAEIGKRYGNIDVAMMENGQYNEDWRYIHTLPTQLPDAIRKLHPNKVFPAHNGKFALARHPWNEPAEMLKEAARSDTSIHLINAVIGQPIAIKEYYLKH